MAKTKSPVKHKVLLVDDHPIVRDGLAMLIGRQKDLVVCGEAEDVPTAIKLARELDPDVLVVDISLKTGNGLDLIKRLQKLDNPPPVLVSSMHDENLYAERAIRAGAQGYISKQVASCVVIEAIHEVLAGRMYLSDAMTQSMLHNAAGRKEMESPLEVLSDRELTVFEMIGHGMTTKKIAERLHLSVKTVETYREKIKDKLNLADAAELTHSAIQWTVEKSQER